MMEISTVGVGAAGGFEDAARGTLVAGTPLAAGTRGAGAAITGTMVAVLALAGAIGAAASGPAPDPIGTAAFIEAVLPKESCPTRPAPSVKIKKSMATAEAQESTGTSRGIGGRM